MKNLRDNNPIGEPTDSIVHIAGPRMTVCGRVIQRCSVCGAVLVDSLGSASPDDSPMGTWPVGRLVRVTVGHPTSFILLPDTDRLPKDNCLDQLGI